MQSNVKRTIARCYDEGMTAANTVAYVLIHHCAAELPPFRTRQKVTEYVNEYYAIRSADKV